MRSEQCCSFLIAPNLTAWQVQGSFLKLWEKQWLVPRVSWNSENREDKVNWKPRGRLTRRIRASAWQRPPLTSRIQDDLTLGRATHGSARPDRLSPSRAYASQTSIQWRPHRAEKWRTGSKPRNPAPSSGQTRHGVRSKHRSRNQACSRLLQ
jgi:hypothetical protein